MNSNPIIGQHSQAVNVLKSIPAKQRTAKCNMALGKLYQQVIVLTQT